jgi:hypothetical protein
MHPGSIEVMTGFREGEGTLGLLDDLRGRLGGDTAFPWVIPIWPSVRILEARRTLWSLFGCSPVSTESVRTECRVRVVTGRPNTTSPGPSGRWVPM